MELESVKTVIITPQFLESACDLPVESGRQVLNALLLFMANPGDPSLGREPFGNGTDGIDSIRVGNSCRILFSSAQVLKLLFVGSDLEARRFVDSLHFRATALAEAPVAFQLHIDFWESEPTAKFETPSCGALVSREGLAGLLMEGRPFLPLAHLLLSRGQEVESLVLGFREIETVLGRALPESARRDPAWWDNDRAHPQTNAWLAIGWQTRDLDLQHETLVFARMHDEKR